MIAVRAGLLSAACVLVAGCDGDRVHHVKGTVTIGGVPVPAGVIWFDPDIGRGNTTGPQGHAEIKDGQFDTRAAGGGVRPGAYRVRVEAFDGRPANELPFGRPILAEPYEKDHEFPDKDSELTVDVPGPQGKRS